MIVGFLQNQLKRIIETEMALFVGFKIHPLELERMPILDYYFYADYAAEMMSRQQEEIENSYNKPNASSKPSLPAFNVPFTGFPT